MICDLDVDAFRAQFSSLPALTYLNSGSYGLLADRVAGAFESYLDTRRSKGADWRGWVVALEAVRARMARLLDVDGDEVAVTGSASAGLNALASALDFSGPRKTVLVSNFEFPTSAQIWHAQERVGARVVHIAESADGIIPLGRFEQAIDDSVAIVALSQVCYRHGGRIPNDDIRAIARIAHARGALVVLDTYQIIGTEPIHPRLLEVDFCIGGMLKYLLGTAGIGFLYVRADLIDRIVPRTSGWFAQAEVNAMDIFANTPSPSARRFEGGTPPVPNCLATAAGLDVVLEAGLEAIGRRVRTVTRYAMEQLAAARIDFANPAEDSHRGPLISVPSRNSEALVDALGAMGIVTSCRDGRLRAGFHAYNVPTDVDRLVAGLDAHRNLLT